MRYPVDTSWAILYLRGQPEVVARIEELAPEGVGISIIALAELEVGVARARDSGRAREVLERFVDSVAVLDVTRPVCALFAEWTVRLDQRGQGLEHFDVLIAATALHYGLMLCTTNRRHFERFEGLSLHPPLAIRNQT